MSAGAFCDGRHIGPSRACRTAVRPAVAAWIRLRNPLRHLEIGHRGSMIRGSLVPPRLDIHPRGPACGCERLARQNEVDAQPALAAETAGTVIPPAVDPVFLVEQAEGVYEAERQDPLQRLAFRLAAKH